MSKSKKLINFAHLNDQQNDLSKCWFVEYSFRLCTDGTLYRRRIYDGLGSGTADDRRKIAAGMIAQVNEYLKSGEYLNHSSDYTPVGISDGYRPEQQRFMAKMEELKLYRLIPRFLEYKKPALTRKSYQCYCSRLKVFREWTERNIGDKIVTQIEQKDIVPFFHDLATEEDLCRKSIEKYMQMVRSFFTWMEEMKIRPRYSNPVWGIPKFGRIIDCAPAPYNANDRERLKNTIFPKDPYLWLACEMIYYCAIRPGTELRLLKIKHISRDSRTITIPNELAKNNHTESVTMPPQLLQLMEQLNVFLYDPELYLFGRNGAPANVPMGQNTMRDRFNQYRELLNISSDHKFYSWKHSGAISAATNGASPYDLQHHLRHRSIATTEEYIRKRIPQNDTAERYIDRI